MSSREPESSLELLLDTMCNTFGGVMFIGISLIVLISMLSKSSTADSVSQERLEELKQELVQLRAEMTKEEASMLRLRSSVDAMEKDPRRQKIAELAALEQETKLALGQFTLEQTRFKSLSAELARLTAANAQLEAKLKNRSKESLDNAKAIAALSSEIEKIQREERSVKPVKMNFRIIETHSQMYYFVILSGNKMWRVGCERTGSGELVPSDDCSYTTKTTAEAKAFHCTVRPERGTDVLNADGSLNREALRLLAAIPSDRGLKFELDASAVPSFIKLREHLNGKRILHGLDPIPTPKTIDIYITSENVKYEY